MILLRASARKLHDFSLSMTHNSHSQARDSDETIQYRVGKTHCQGHQDPSKRVFIFLGETEALIKMVFINRVFIPRCSTVRRSRRHKPQPCHRERQASGARKRSALGVPSNLLAFKQMRAPGLQPIQGHDMSIHNECRRAQIVQLARQEVQYDSAE